MFSRRKENAFISTSQRNGIIAPRGPAVAMSLRRDSVTLAYCEVGARDMGDPVVF